MGFLRQSWESFGEQEARTYLRGESAREEDGRRVLMQVMQQALPAMSPRILDVGCGNGNLYPIVRQVFPDCSYTGADTSGTLLKAARVEYPDASFVETDCETLHPWSSGGQGFDVAVYSHVIEILESPERSLAAARALAPCVLIEFFEPPADQPDTVELRTMDHGMGPVPYLRRRISLRVYEAWLASAGFTQVDRYFTTGKYEVHLLR